MLVAVAIYLSGFVANDEFSQRHSWFSKREHLFQEFGTLLFFDPHNIVGIETVARLHFTKDDVARTEKHGMVAVAHGVEKAALATTYTLDHVSILQLCFNLIVPFMPELFFRKGRINLVGWLHFVCFEHANGGATRRTRTMREG